MGRDCVADGPVVSCGEDVGLIRRDLRVQGTLTGGTRSENWEMVVGVDNGSDELGGCGVKGGKHAGPTSTQQSQRRRKGVRTRDQLLDDTYQLRAVTDECRSTMKQKEHRFFQTVNHAKIVWNNKSKLRGILGGHLNIRSLMPKLDQVHILLTESNLDYICLSET